MTIGEVCLLTNDVPRVARFYKQLLGVGNNIRGFSRVKKPEDGKLGGITNQQGTACGQAARSSLT